jgi:hypothetical protein
MGLAGRPVKWLLRPAFGTGRHGLAPTDEFQLYYDI